MPITINPFDAEIISDEELALWKTVPSAVACDAMNRTNGMIADIQSLAPDTILAGQALTVHAPNGTNAPLHHAVKCALPDASSSSMPRTSETRPFGEVL
jgi:regulator of RNase E activity RraA